GRAIVRHRDRTRARRRGTGRDADRAGKPRARRASAGDARGGREVGKGNAHALSARPKRGVAGLNLDRDGWRRLEPFPFRLNRNGTLDSCFDAFSSREPVSTSLETL